MIFDKVFCNLDDTDTRRYQLKMILSRHTLSYIEMLCSSSIEGIICQNMYNQITRFFIISLALLDTPRYLKNKYFTNKTTFMHTLISFRRILIYLNNIDVTLIWSMCWFRLLISLRGCLI